MSLEGVKVHPQALVESGDVGDGTVVWAFAHIMQGAVVGSDCKVGDHAFVESGSVVGDRVTIKNNALIWHGVRIGDDVFVGPNVVFTNDLMPRAHKPSSPADWMSTTVARGATLGANATIVCGVHIGEHSMVGAGSVVTHDVRPYELVAGNPARHIGWVCECGARLDGSLECAACGREYLDEAEGLRLLDD